jgi:hypothetical protein
MLSSGDEQEEMALFDTMVDQAQHGWYNFDLGAAHAALARACIIQIFISASGWIEDGRRCTSVRMYARTYWAKHIALATPLKTSNGLLLRLLDRLAAYFMFLALDTTDAHLVADWLKVCQ